MEDLSRELRASIKRQSNHFEQSLNLNPTENFPLKTDIYPNGIEKLNNLYISDVPNRNETAKTIFGGRESAVSDIVKIYDFWAKKLGAKKISMRPLSGLHVHTLVFLGLKKLGDRVLLLPEIAGGHFCTEKILKTLGYKVTLMPVDFKNLEIDFKATKALIDTNNYDFIFVDRSEGLNYVDFSPILKDTNIYSIYDASHFLSHIILGDYKNPFDMGFDMCVSTIHKNFPGPQKAIVYTKEDDKYWEEVEQAMKTFVSSIHATDVYAAGLVISDTKYLKKYSKLNVDNAASLEKELYKLGLPAIQRKKNQPGAYYIWLAINDQQKAYKIFRDLEKTGINTNYRLLPYNLGYGLRLGTAPAISYGLRPKDTPELAKYIANVYKNGFNKEIALKFKCFLKKIKENRLDK
jgi:glycine/serine hydroxymethyltransferase